MKYHFDIFGVYTDTPANPEERFTDVPIPGPADSGMVWMWDGFGWNIRAAAPPTPDPVEAPARHISVGSFFDRFGANKWPILADTNPLVQALIKDCSVRKFINLDDQRLAAGLGLLVEAGHAIDVKAILAAPVQSSEKP